MKKKQEFTDKVFLTKDSKLFCELLGNHKRVDVTDTLPYRLHKTLVLDPGVTLRNLLEVVYPFRKELNILADHWLECHVEHYMKHRDVNRKPKDLDYVEVYHIAYGESHKGEYSFDSFYAGNDFHGRKGNEAFALELGTFDDIANCKLQLRKTYDVEMFKYGKKPPRKKIMKNLGYDYPLREVIVAIFYEMSFFGPPEEVIKTGKDMRKRIDEIKSGKAKLIPWEKVKAKLTRLVKKNKKKK